MNESQDLKPVTPPTMYLVKDIELVVGRLMDRVLRPLGLTMNRFMVLANVHRESGLTSADMARRLHVSPQAVVGVVSELESAGFIVRKVDPTHSRRLIIDLTRSGEEMVERCTGAFALLETRAMERLESDAELQLREMLATVRETLTDLDNSPFGLTSDGDAGQE